ncbi:hypothetical protein [Bacillus sp. E(2018)]|uniref:hypothetical protein n=1 Tax=Bacillus sp. E(2018) TaxID=2502239 RepID=UPI0010F80329|nr:hypothetical protein [Bacillus sp. E(2018)]
MVKMRLKIENNSNNLKYIPIIRQNNGASIKNIKRNIEDGNSVLECDYFDTDQLKSLKRTMDALISKGATVHLFQDARAVQIDYISNLINSYEQIAEDRKNLDDRILGDN